MFYMGKPYISLVTADVILWQNVLKFIVLYHGIFCAS